MSNKKLYLFDFDGTISNRDSFGHFFLKSFEFRVLFFTLLLNFHKILFSIVSNQKLSKTKEIITSILLKGKSKSEIKSLGELYVDKYIDQILRAKALSYIKEIQKDEKNDIYVVSASLDIWLLPLAKKIDVLLICTELEYVERCFTGSFKTKNCKGKEKVYRIKKEIKLMDYKEIISFGDSKGDKEMLGISDETMYKPFRK